MDRRRFLASAAAAASAHAAIPGATADTDKPIRATPLRATFSGPQYYDEQERRELVDVLETRRPFRWYGPGNEPPRKVATFEIEFAKRTQTRFALAVTSGTAALQTALAALEVGPGDEVILPAWTWYSCYNAIVLAGALPVFAEIDESFNIDSADLAQKITPQTKVLMAVHLLGSPCDMTGVLALARRHGLKLLEDCAQSLGASYQGRPVGSLGDVGIYSMQINKTITSGEGGALVTNDPVLFERASRFHDLGNLRQPHAERVGGSKVGGFVGSQFRMSEFTGGVLLAQLRKLDTIVGSLRSNAQRIVDGLRDLSGLKLRRTFDPDGDLGSCVFLDLETPERRKGFMAAMAAENVPATAPSGSVILPIQPSIETKTTVHPAWPSFTSERGKSIVYGASCCPRTIAILARYAGVALDPKFSRGDVDDIIAAIRKVYPRIMRG
jgi:8-amino-3,8-dideoxy-alpha-D-manno-octulosonate transaminase